MNHSKLCLEASQADASIRRRATRKVTFADLAQEIQVRDLAQTKILDQAQGYNSKSESATRTFLVQKK